MLDILGILVVAAFFIGCELYVRYCDRLMTTSGQERGTRDA